MKRDDFEWLNLVQFGDFIEITRIVLEKRGSTNLRPSGIAALKAGWDGLDYATYSKENDSKYTPNTLRTQACKIYGELSDYFQVDDSLNKFNIRVTFHKLFLSGKLDEFEKAISQKPPAASQPPKDLTFVGRDNELSKLHEQLIETSCVNVWGARGNGKTAFVREYLQRAYKDQSIWIDWSSSFSLETWATQALVLMGKPREESPIDSLFEFLFQEEYLLIIDNADNIDELYDAFIGNLISNHCSSKFIIISNQRNDKVWKAVNAQSFNLSGLQEYTDLFKTLNLSGDKCWNKLAKKYNNNVFSLVNIAEIINEYFEGDVCQYLKNSSTIFSSELLESVQNINLSEIEIVILAEINNSARSRPSDLFFQLKDAYSSHEILDSIRNLESQSLIEQDSQGYYVSPVVKKHLTMKGEF